MTRCCRWLPALLFVLLVSACAPPSVGSSASPSSSTFTPTGGALAQPLQKINVPLTTTAGQPFNVATDTTGKVTLVYFGYTHCPDACPITMSLMANAFKNLTPAQQAKVDMVFITTDPARDTPTVLRTWLDQYNPHFIGLVPTPAELVLAEVAEHLPEAQSISPSPGGSPGAYYVQHSTLMPVFGLDGEAHMAYITGSGMTVAGVTSDLRHLLAGQTPVG